MCQIFSKYYIFHQKEVNQLHQAILPRLLNRMGFTRTFPLAVVFGSKFSGGLQCVNIRAAQDASKICRAIKHVRANTKTGRKFITMINWAQLSTGMETLVPEETKSYYIWKDSAQSN